MTRFKIDNLQSKGSHSNSFQDPAVSPVVGIMLMLTVTLILAAIISGFAGGIAKTQPKPPQLVIEASMVNGEPSETSFLDIRVISVSEGIPSKDLKFQTEWKDQNQQAHRTSIIPGTSGYPIGYNPGNLTPYPFGNFTLLAGSHILANNTSSLDTVLTDSWKNMQEGTPVRLQFIHIPSGSIIADKEITAEV